MAFCLLLQGKNSRSGLGGKKPITTGGDKYICNMDRKVKAETNKVKSLYKLPFSQEELSILRNPILFLQSA